MSLPLSESFPTVTGSSVLSLTVPSRPGRQRPRRITPVGGPEGPPSSSDVGRARGAGVREGRSRRARAGRAEGRPDGRGVWVRAEGRSGRLGGRFAGDVGGPPGTDAGVVDGLEWRGALGVDTLPPPIGWGCGTGLER